MDNRLQVLTGARDRIAAGWCKRRLKDEDGRHCAIGAILADMHSAFMSSPEVIYPFTSVVAAHLPEFWTMEELDLLDNNRRAWMQIVGYNNYLGTTQADVLALFDRAIASLQPANAVIAKAQDTDLITDEIQENEKANTLDSRGTRQFHSVARERVAAVPSISRAGVEALSDEVTGERQHNEVTA